MNSHFNAVSAEEHWSRAEAFGDDFNGSPCMYLPNAPFKDGYVRVQIAGRGKVLGHRLMYEALIGEIPAGLTLDHGCRNRACVNPWHCEPMTLERNQELGKAARTKCRRGHDYDNANTFIDSRGSRGCRICRRASQDRWDAKQRGGGTSRSNESPN